MIVVISVVLSNDCGDFSSDCNFGDLKIFTFGDFRVSKIIRITDTKILTIRNITIDSPVMKNHNVT